MQSFIWADGRSGRIEINDTSLEAVSYGPAPDQAPTIVLLHEGLGCVELWRDFPSRLAQATGYGVFVYSRAGYGKSAPCALPRPLDYMTREAMDVVPGVLDVISFQKGILFGHSDGATIAAIYSGGVVDHRVRGLVLMAPHFFTEPVGLKSIEAAKASFENGELRNKLAKYHKNVDCAFRGWNDAWLDPGFEDWNVSDAIDYWRVPVLALQGRDDEYGSLAQIREIESRIYSPVDVEILDGCGHAPHIEKSEEILAHLTDFTVRLSRIENEVVAF